MNAALPSARRQQREALMSVNDYDPELYAAIQDLELDGTSAAYGIAMQVVRRGYDSLGPKQKYVYDSQVALLLKRQAE